MKKLKKWETMEGEKYEHKFKIKVGNFYKIYDNSFYVNCCGSNAHKVG